MPFIDKKQFFLLLAGDHVKFGFPLAWTTSTLAWGLVEFRDAYVSAGQLDFMLDSIKWPLDYFIKCHVSEMCYSCPQSKIILFLSEISSSPGLTPTSSSTKSECPPPTRSQSSSIHTKSYLNSESPLSAFG